MNDMLLFESGVAEVLGKQKVVFMPDVRANFEVLLRKLLRLDVQTGGPSRGPLSSRPPAVVLFTSMRERPTFARGNDRAARFQNSTYGPVAELYDVPHISYRDVIASRGRKPTPTALWQTEKGAHPVWHVHQLMADVMSYSWVVHERALAEVGASAIAPGSARVLPEPAFAVGDAGALLECSTYLSEFSAKGAGEASQRENFVPLRVGRGWEFVYDRQKSGWQYDAGRRRVGTSQLKDAGKSIDEMPRITFAMHFSAKTILVVTAMRSHARFSDAVVFIDDGNGHDEEGGGEAKGENEGAGEGGGESGGVREADRAIKETQVYRRDYCDGHGARDERHSIACTEMWNGRYRSPWTVPGVYSLLYSLVYSLLSSVLTSWYLYTQLLVTRTPTPT